MAKNLVIVESPAKAKTIEGYLGKDFIVKSSMGHIRDLSKGDAAVNVENGFLPSYEIPADKKNTVADLRKHSKAAEEVWLATDEDREGEAISWHLAEVLGLDVAKTKRIIFHEITKKAILNAIDNPRTIDMHLVEAQQARRVLDRLVGFELSPVLWKKIKPGLSAGRVQSVAVRLIVEREREIAGFESSYEYKVQAIFDIKDDSGKVRQLKADGKKFKDIEGAEKFLQSCMGAAYATKEIEKKPAKRSPAPPFTTSTLQQEAARKLGYGVGNTMQVAQRLYEAGHITYMRTDSVNLSEQALGAAKNEIERAYGKEFARTRHYKTKSSGAQEAHEAIRPTDFGTPTISAGNQEERLYQLIWKRAIASQMEDAEFERTIVDIGISTNQETLTAQGEVLKFEGFLKVYIESTDDDEDEEAAGMLPPISKGQLLPLNNMTATQRFARPSARYTEASLVKKLEENGIGRPSTYAPTISTIQKRGYVVKEDREGKQREFETLTLAADKISKEKKTENYGAEKAKLFPSDIGSVVTDFLVMHFGDIMDYQFTATVEQEFDEIAEGRLKWDKMLGSFYKPFHATVDKTAETAERQKGERELGIDPKSGKKVIARIGRYGPLVQIGGEGEDKPVFANLSKGQMIESLTLEEALDLFKLPRIAGTLNNLDMKVAIGRYGPYILYKEKYYNLAKEDDPYTVTEERCIEIIDAKDNGVDGSLPKTLGQLEGKDVIVGKGFYGPFVQFEKLYANIPKAEDPMTLTYERAVELIKAKQEKEANKVIKAFAENKDVQVLNGRYGPYIGVGKQNVRIPKETDPASLTLEQCLKLWEEQGGTPAKAKIGKATTTKKAAAKKPAAKKAGK